MIPALAAAVPPHLAPYAARLAVGRGGVRLAEVVGSRSAFTQATASFAGRVPGADERAVLSYWTLFAFAALIVPSVAALVRLRRVLPVGFDTLRCDLGADGAVERFWLPHEGRPLAPGEDGTAALASHLSPFVERCAGWSGLSRRVLWCNAGTMVDFAIRELGAATPAGRDLVGPDLAGAEALLAQPYHPAPPEEPRRRRVCCLRYRLDGVADCGALCPLLGPLEAKAGRSKSCVGQGMGT